MGYDPPFLLPILRLNKFRYDWRASDRGPSASDTAPGVIPRDTSV